MQCVTNVFLLPDTNLSQDSGPKFRSAVCSYKLESYSFTVNNNLTESLNKQTSKINNAQMNSMEMIMWKKPMQWGNLREES